MFKFAKATWVCGLRVLLLLVGLQAFMANSCWATDYRVSTQREFDAVKNRTLLPGDAILLERGKQFYGMLAPLGTGTATNPIRIDAYGEGPRPQIHAMGENQAGLRLTNASYWEVQGLEITNTDGTDNDQGNLFGILAYYEDVEGTYRHLYINDFYIHHVNGAVPGKGRGGIHVRVDNGLRATKLDDLRITNNRIEDVGGVGIANYAKHANVDLLPSGGLFTENLWTRVYVAGNYLNRTGRNCMIARVSENAVYEYNVLANSSRYDKGHSLFCFDTLGITIQYNEAYGNVGTDSADRGGFDADYNCANTLIQYNYSHDNEWFCGIMKRPNRNVVIRYNISQDERQGFYFWGFENSQSCESVHIYNNTHFIRAGNSAVVNVQNRTPLNAIFENNIFYFEDAADSGYGINGDGINTIYTNNLYYNITPHPSDPSPHTANPLLTLPGVAGTDIDLRTMGAMRGYQLLTGSPAIDASTDIADNGGQDIVGNQIDVGPADLGAVEYNGPVSRVTFDFLEGSKWDGGSRGGKIGSNVTLTNPLTGESIRLTTLDVIGQDGSRASDGAGHTLNVVAAANYLGVNDQRGNPGGYSSEYRYFNPGEAWVCAFDRDVYLENIQLASQTDDAELTLSSDLFEDLVMKAGRPDNIHDMGFRHIPAGTELTLTMTTPSDGVDTGLGIKGITVSAVPFWFQDPPILQAETYDDASGIVTQPCPDVNGGEMVVFDRAADEIAFDVYVPDAGDYWARLRVASTAGTVDLNLFQNETWLAGIQSDIGRGAAWTTLEQPITLEAGASTLRVSSGGGDCRLNWMEFRDVNDVPEDPETGRSP